MKVSPMAGNVWHLTVNLPDPVVTRFKYRITNIPTPESSRMGGSWARNQEYLGCGNHSELSSGIGHGDFARSGYDFSDVQTHGFSNFPKGSPGSTQIVDRSGLRSLVPFVNEPDTFLNCPVLAIDKTAEKLSYEKN